MMATINWGDLWKFAGVVPSKPERPAPPELPTPPEPKPFPITLEGMVAELEREFASNPHWTGKGRVTRPIVLMARIVSELAVRAK